MKKAVLEGALKTSIRLRFLSLCLAAFYGCSPTENTSNSSVQKLVSASDVLEESSTVYIYAASSLERFVSEINKRYRKSSPDVKVVVSLVGSQTARLQLERGAPPGVFISADIRHIHKLIERGKVSEHQTLARNMISLLTREDSVVDHIDDLQRGQGFAIGVEQVPVGRYAWDLLRAHFKERGEDRLTAFVNAHLRTQEVSARALKARLRRGEVESAFLYQSDLDLLKGMREVPLPSRLTPYRQVKIAISLTRLTEDSQASEDALKWYQLAISRRGGEAIEAARLLPLTMRNENLLRR